MNTRKAAVDIIWNGAAVSGKLLGQGAEITYTDPASGEADSLDISLQDRDRRWIGPWFPAKGDTLEASIRVTDWDREGDNRLLPCGSFILDDFSFSGWPVTGTVSSVSVPADSSFRETERSKTWEDVTLQELAQEIAGRAGVTLAWDVEGGGPKLKSVEQTKRTDCEFLTGVCGDYGLVVKVYAKKLVVYDREAYKKKEPVALLTPADLLSWSWKTSLAGTYTGGGYAYTDPMSEEEISVETGKGPRLLKLSGKADSAADAERKLKAAIASANHGHTTLSASLRGRPDLAASLCVGVAGLGRLDGKYFIDKAVHHVGGGYTTDLELSLVE